MNQVTNLVQWKNLTQEQKDDFDFEDYKYVMQYSHETVWTNPRTPVIEPGKNPNAVYRLVIEDDKWYTGFINGELVTCLGSCFDGLNPEILRPARPDEIPVAKEKTLEQKIQEMWPGKEVVMLEPDDFGFLSLLVDCSVLVNTLKDVPHAHIYAQSMKGFAGYIYTHDDDLIKSLKPTKNWKCKTLQPVAVLFEE